MQYVPKFLTVKHVARICKKRRSAVCCISLSTVGGLYRLEYVPIWQHPAIDSYQNRHQTRLRVVSLAICNISRHMCPWITIEEWIQWVTQCATGCSLQYVSVLVASKTFAWIKAYKLPKSKIMENEKNKIEFVRR